MRALTYFNTLQEPVNIIASASLIIGVSLSEPHTSVTTLAEVVCMFVAIYRKF